MANKLVLSIQALKANPDESSMLLDPGKLVCIAGRFYRSKHISPADHIMNVTFEEVEVTSTLHLISLRAELSEWE